LITINVVACIVFRYERELHPTRWNSIRQGLIFSVYVGWLFLVTYIVYLVGFIFGSLLMSYGDQNKLNITDILVVSVSYNKINQKIII
jgi:hypothetical protein